MNRRQLLDKIRTHYLKDYYNYNKVSSQLKRYEEQGFSYDTINDILHYWYDIKKEKPEKSNGGIAIIEYILVEYNNWKKSQEEQEKTIKLIKQNINKLNYKEKEYTVNPTPIKRPLHLKLFNLE